MSKTEAVLVRVTPSQLKAWRQLAKQAKRTVSDVIRIVMDDAVETGRSR